MHGMGDNTRLWKLHRQDVGREIWSSRRRPRRSSGRREEAGRLAALWRELGADAGRLVGILGLSVKGRERKGMT